MRLYLAAVLVPLALAGCGDDTSSESSSGSDEAALRSAVEAYSDAYLTGDADTAYSLLSKRCQDRMSAAEFGAIVEQAGQMYGSALELTSFDAEVSGDLARVSYGYEVESIDQDSEPWVREGGEWREDDC